MTTALPTKGRKRPHKQVLSAPICPAKEPEVVYSYDTPEGKAQKEKTEKLQAIETQKLSAARSARTDNNAVYFVAKKMFPSDTHPDSEINRTKLKVPGARIFLMPETGADKFIIETLKDLRAKGPISTVYINAHGSPNSFTTAPNGIGDLNTSIDTRKLFESLAATQKDIQKTQGPQTKLAQQIVLDSCSIFNSISHEDSVRYRNAAVALQAPISASTTDVATEPFSGKTSGDYFTYKPDGSVVREPRWRDDPEGIMQRQILERSVYGESRLQVACAAKHGVDACGRQDTPEIKEVGSAIYRLARAPITKEPNASVEKDVSYVMNHAEELPLRDRLAGYYMASRKTSNPQVAQAAAQAWEKTINKLPAGDRTDILLVMREAYGEDPKTLEKIEKLAVTKAANRVETKARKTLGCANGKYETAKTNRMLGISTAP